MKHLFKLALVLALMVTALPAQSTSNALTAGFDVVKPWPPHDLCPLCPEPEPEQVSGSLDWPPHDDCPICPGIEPREANSDWPPHWPWPEVRA